MSRYEPIYLWLLFAGMPVAPLTICSAQAVPAYNFDQAAIREWVALDGTPRHAFDSIISLRIAELAGLQDAGEPAPSPSELTQLLNQAISAKGPLHDNAWGSFALASALQTIHGTCRPLATQAPRSWFTHCRRVVDAYQRSLKLDSAFAPVIVELNRLVPWPELWEEPTVELRHHEAVLASDSLPAAARRELLRRQLMLRLDLEPADTLRLRMERGEDSVFTAGERAFLRSRVVALAGSGPAAMDAYVRAANDIGPGLHLDWIAQDLGLVATPAERTEWDSLPTEERAQWVREFWAARDFRDGRSAGGRLTAHVERWRVAFARYRMFGGDMRLRGASVASRRTRDCSPELSDSSVARFVLECNLPPSFDGVAILDARGKAYMRHGEPQQRVNYPGIQYFESESWMYRLVDGMRAIHFKQWLEHPLVGMRAQEIPAGDWMTACQVTPRFCVLAARRSLNEEIPPERMLMVRERGREELQEILQTDEAIQRFANVLPLNAQVTGLGPSSGLATVSVDIPLASLRELADSSNRVVLRWQFRTRPPGGGSGVSKDTLRGIVLPPPGEIAREKEAVVTLVDVVAIPPGMHDLRLVVSDTGERRGALYHRQGVVLLAPDEIGITDLALLAAGEHGTSGTMEGEVVRVSPTFAPGTTGELDIGYVLVGLAGQDVSVGTAVWKVGDDSARARISVTSVERPALDRQFTLRRLGVKELSEGAYDLIVTVTLPSGTTQQRRQRFLVRE